MLKRLWLVIGGALLIALGMGAGLWMSRGQSPAADAHGDNPPPISTAAIKPDDPVPGHEADQPAHGHDEHAPAGDAHAHAPVPPVTVHPPSTMSRVGLPPLTPEEEAQLALRPPTKDVFAACDELVREGNYAAAHDELAKLARTATGLHEARARFRLGLCEEVLGNLNRAQEEYRIVVALNPGPILREAAMLGQARVWELSDHSDAAIRVLYRSLLEDLRSIPDSTRSQLPHQLACTVAARVRPASVTPGASEDPLSELFLAIPRRVIRPDQVLDDLAGRDDFPTATPHNQLQIQIVNRYSDAPDEIFLQLHTDRLPAMEVVQLAASVAGWTVTFSEAARGELLERTLLPDCENMSLGMVLDCCLEQFGVTWRQTPTGLQVFAIHEAPTDELRQAEYRAARRALKMAVTTAPMHRWSVVSSLELGRTLAVHGQLEDAQREISRAIEKYSRTSEIALGWFNLGKLHLRRGDLSKALASFRRAMDMLGGHPYEAAAYLYVGRIMLEQDSPREAVLPLTRAVSLSSEGPLMGTSATLLSSAYLMLEHYQRANDILKEQKASLSSGEIVDTAAFLAGLIRFRASSDVVERNRQGVALLCAMTNLKLDHCFGGHWSYLAGMAYRDTGLVPEELAVFQKALASGYSYPLQRRMRMALLDDAPPGAAPDIPVNEDAVANPVELLPVRTQALLARATLASRQGDDAGAMGYCRELLADPTVPVENRREALKIMGRVYQLRGDHQRAVDCLTGIVPTDELTSDGPRAQLPEPRRIF